MAGKLVPSDSTQAMASLMSAYGGDEEADDDTIHDTSRMSAQADDERASSPETRTQPDANFISDDEDPRHSPQNSGANKAEPSTKSPEPRAPEVRTG